MKGKIMGIHRTQIELRQTDAQKILSYALENLPNEACGLLGGVIKNDIIVIKEVYLLTNIDASRVHFAMDTKEQLAAVKDMRAKGLDLIGNWHSHPKAPPQPSEEDKKLAYDSDLIYGILSLMNETEPVFNAFIIERHQRVSACTITLVD